MEANTNKNSKGGVVLAFLRQNKWVIAAGFFVIAIFVLIGVIFIPKPSPQEQPEIKVGQTSISKVEYQKMLDQAGAGGDTSSSGEKTQQPNQYVKAVITDYVKAKEAARQLGIDVPNYLVASQQSKDMFVPYASLNDFQKAVLYIQAVDVMVDLRSQGGTTVTVLHMPYDASTIDELGQSDEQFARASADDIVKRSLSTQEINGEALSFMYNETRFNASPESNQSGVYAITNSGNAIVSTATDDSSDGPTKEVAIPSEFIAISKDLPANRASAVKSFGQHGFVIVYKNDSYKQQSDIREKYDAIIARREG